MKHTHNLLKLLVIVLVLCTKNNYAQINGNLFNWQGGLSSSWSNSLNWQVWNTGTSTWVTNSLGTFPNSPTHTVTVDFTSATTKTLNLDVTTGNADVAQFFLINNASNQVRFEINPNKTLTVYNTFSVSGTSTNSISIYCSTAINNAFPFGGYMQGGGTIILSPDPTTTINPVFANATITNVGLTINGLGTSNIFENNLTFQSVTHQLGNFNLNGNTLNCVSSFILKPQNAVADVGMSNLLGSTINTQNLILSNTAQFNFAAQTTTINLNGANTSYAFCDVQYGGNSLATSTSTLALLTVSGNKAASFLASSNSSQDILIEKLISSEELIFNTSGPSEYHIKHFNLTKPLSIISLNLGNSFKDIESITTAPSSCVAAYHFISQNNQVNISANVPVTVNNMSFFNAKVISTSSITSNGGVDMGYNSGIIFNASPTSFGTTTLTWNGSVDDKWMNPLNWTPNCVPTILTNVIVPGATPNKINLVASSGICYHFNTTNTPTLTIHENTALIIGGNFVRSSGTVIKNYTGPTSTTQSNIFLLGILPNTTYNITSNNTLLPYCNLSINANQVGATYQLTDKFSVNYPGQNNLGHLNLYTGRLLSNGFGIDTKGLYINKNNVATSTRSLNIANSTVNTSNFNLGTTSSLYIECTNTKEFNTTGSSIYFYNNPLIPNNHVITIVNLPANNHLASPSFSLNRVIFESSTQKVAQFNFSGGFANTSLLSGFKVNSVKALGDLVISTSSGVIKNLLNIDSLYVTGGFSLIGQANNSITVNGYISSSANCQTGSFAIMSSSVGLAATNQFYINTGPSFTFTPLNYWNVDAVKVNQYAGGSPAITVNNANLSANSGTSPSNGWNINTYTPQTYYWVGEGATTNWTDLDNWSYSVPTNGDEPTAGCLPNIYDDVLFTKLSFFGSTGSSVNTTSVVTVNQSVSFKDMRWLGPFNTTISGTTPLYPTITNTITNIEINAAGSVRMHKTMKWNFGNTVGNLNNVHFSSLVTDTIEMQNNSFGGNIFLEGTGRYVALDSLVLANVTSNYVSPNFRGTIIHKSGELDLEGHKLFACAYQSSDGTALPRKLNANNSTLTFVQVGVTSPGITFGNTIANTYTLNTLNSIINIKPYSDYAVLAYNTLMQLVTNTLVTEPRLNFNVIKVRSFSASNTQYKINVLGKGTDIDSLLFDVSNTYLYNTVATETNTINYLKYKVGSTNELTSGATTLLKELDAKSTCDPIIIQSSIVGGNVNICPSSTVALQANQTSLKYINSACGAYVLPNYNIIAGSLSSFIPSGTENVNGWSINSTATSLGFISITSGTTNCNQLPYTINANEFNASITTHTLVWQSANGTYSGTPANGLDLTSFTTTATGVHTLTVTYKSGCSVIDTYTLNVINDVVPALTSTNVTCNGLNNGTAFIAVSPSTLSTGAYVYSISPGSYTTSALSGLAANVYSYSVINSINPTVCKTTGTFSITQPAVLITNASITSTVACFGASTASLTSSPNGGNGGNVYFWDNGSTTYTTQNINNVVAGTYSLTVTDSENCTSTNTLQVNEPLNAVSASVANTSQAGCGLSNGSITLTTTGGTAAYTYSWVPVSASSYTTIAATNNSLSIGTTSIYVIDANGCVATASVSITNPNAPILTPTITNIICYGTNTGAIATDVVASSACSYTWSNNTYSADLSGVGAGVYTVTIQDANLCISIQTVAITQPSVAMGVLIDNIVNACLNQANGSATVAATNGLPAYTYTWQPTNINSNVLTNAPIGSYTVYATDANGCVANTVVNLALSTNPVTASLNSLTTATCQQSNGSVLIDVTGGSPQYSYQWLPNNITTQHLENVTAGSYTVVVTDNTGCVDTLAVTLTCKVPLFIPEFFSPNGNGKNDLFEIKGIENYPNNTVNIFNRWGNLVYTKKQYDNTFNGKANVSNSMGNGLLPAGTYFIVIDFGDNGTTKDYHGYLELKY